MKFICVGDNCIDYYIDKGIGYPGGNPVNVAVYCRRDYIECSYIGCVGNDIYGSMIIDALANKGVDISHIKVLSGNTARSDVVIVDHNRVFTDYNEGVLPLLALDTKDLEYINKYNLFITSIYSYTDQYLKDISIPKVYDFSDNKDINRWNNVLPYIDYIFYSDDISSIEEIKEYILKIYNNHKVIVCTRGKNGSIAYNGKQFYIKEAKECKVVDTMGAGDSYIAGFMIEYMSSYDIVKALDKGNEYSAITIGYNGAW